MKLLSNESEYREWMINDYLQLGDELSFMFEPHEREKELLIQMPKEFCNGQLKPDTDLGALL
jgi:hypothetical protein